MKPRRESAYYYGEGPFPHKQTTVWEREKGEQPVLYGPKGEPLTWKRPALGFQPPNERKP